jgi:glucokinase-like ROK family protein
VDHTVRHSIHNTHHTPLADSTKQRSATVQGANLQGVREFNRLLVLNCIREHGPLARVMVARHTGLSRTTVSHIVDMLLQEGFVREGELVDATREGGRRAILVHFNAHVGYIIGIDIGRTHLTLLLANLAAEIVARYAGPFDTSRGPEVCMPLLIARVHTFLAEADLSLAQIIGIGMGIPGPLDTQLQRVSAPTTMPGWDRLDIWQILQQEFAVPIYMDKDANMGTLGESRYGCGRGGGYLAYIKIGTGIGAGISIDGRIYRGHNGSAGELGHITIDEDGPLCICGNHGCLEALAGAQAIVRDACQGLSLAKLQREDTTTSTREVQGRALDIMDVIEAAQEGNAACQAALERAGQRIGLALAGLVNLLNPEKIVIGGGVAQAGELLLAPLRQAVATSSLPAAWQGTRILAGELGDQAIALGAISSVIDAAFSMPMPMPTSVQRQEGPLETTTTSVLNYYRAHVASSYEIRLT